MKQLFLVFTLSLVTLIAPAQEKKQADLRLLRNATLAIRYGGYKILVDPMFAPKGSTISITGNGVSPLVDLPATPERIALNVKLVLVTHNHFDHYDTYATAVLNKELPLFHQPEDEAFFRGEGFLNASPVHDQIVWNGITITRTLAQHGSGRVLQEMGPSSGYVLQAPDLPTIYIVGDAIWTQEIYQNMQRFRPDYIVVNSGGAAMPGFEATPIIMDAGQTMSLIQESGDARVIAVHMDVIDHCHTTRAVLREKASEYNIPADKLLIPEDGELIELISPQ